MIDPKLLRSSPEEVARNLARRGYRFDVSRVAGTRGAAPPLADRDRPPARGAQRHAKAVGQARGRGEDIAPLMQQGRGAGRGSWSSAEQRFNAVQAQLERWQLELPNLLHESVPDGSDECANVEVAASGEPR